MPKSVLFDRDEVLKKVTQLFWKKGYNGTSMQDLVDATGLNRSSLYNTFGDKFQLYMESLKHYQCLQTDLMNSSFAKESPKEALMALFGNIKDSVMGKTNNLGCFLTNCTSELGSDEPQVHEFLIANKENMLRAFESLILKAQKAGEISAEKDAKHLALFLFSSLQGLRLTSMLTEEVSDIDAVTAYVMSAL